MPDSHNVRLPATQTEADMHLVKRGHTDAQLGAKIRQSLAFEAATQRLAARDLYWSIPLGQFSVVY